MTETEKKTVGLAIASLVLGCFFIIPILGALLGILAVIFGIIALVKISDNKEQLKGRGMAIAGIIMGAFSIVVIPIIGLLAAIAIPNMLRARISANDALAQSTLRTLSTATETYYTANNGDYPDSVNDLINAVPPYLREPYCGRTISGYSYTCSFYDGGYKFVASPEESGTSGSGEIVMETGGIMTSKKQDNYRY